MDENAATSAFGVAAQNAINLARVEAGSVAAVTSFLGGLEADLVKILAENKDLAPGKKDKLQKILASSQQAIGKTYDSIAAQQQADLIGVAKAGNKVANKMANAHIGVDVAGAMLTEKQLQVLVDGKSIFGHSSADWWKAQDDGLRMKFAGAIQQGYALGEDVDALTRRIRGTKAAGYKDGVMQISRREAEAIVRSSVQTISNNARLESFNAMSDTVKGVEWVATLDTRTTVKCRALDGKKWTLPDLKPVGHDKVFPGPTAHWGCRSTQIPVLYSWEELAGKPLKQMDSKTYEQKLKEKLKAKGMDDQKIATAVSNARASMDGQVAGSPDMDAWMKKLPTADVKKMIGPTRTKLLNEGKITISDLTDQNNRPLTVSELLAAVEGDGFPIETEGNVFAAFDLDKFQTGKAVSAEAQAAAAKKIADVMANPKAPGNSIMATNLAKVQAAEPSLTPAEAWAKAEEQTAAKIAANTKSSVLSKAKKKLLAGEEPTAAQQLLIDDMGEDEKAAWLESIADAKKAAAADAAAVKLEKLDAVITHAATTNFKSFASQEDLDNYFDVLNTDGLGTFEKSALQDKLKQQVVSNKVAETQAKVLKKLKDNPLADPYDGLENDVFEMMGLDAKAGQDLENFIFAEGDKAKAGVKIAQWTDAGGAKGQAMAAALAKHPDNPLQAANAAQENLGGLVAASTAGETSAASKKAMKALTGMDSPTAESVDAWLKQQGKDPEEFLTEFQAVAKEKADQSVKSSVLSKAKKKLAAGESPTPAQKAAIDSLTPEEKAAFDEQLADLQGKQQAETVMQQAVVQKDIAEAKVAKLEALVDDVPDPASMKVLKTLSGSTRPVLMEDANGKKWVVKSPDQGGGGKPHLQNEAAADEIYRLMGADVPRSKYLEIDGKSYKVAEYLEGSQTLGEWEKTATPAQKKAMHREISKNFASDALMGNWDVLGQSNDNVVVTAAGKPVRIDNGGALDFRAQGAKKTAAQWNATVDELKTLRDPSKAAGQTAKVFSGLTDADINSQISALVARRDELVSEVRRLKGDDVAEVFAARLDYMKRQLPADSTPSTPAAKLARQATFESIPPDVGQRIQKARLNGASLPVGSTHVEDMQALTWAEKTASGDAVTVTQMKVTDEGSAAIMKTIGEQLKKAAPAASVPVMPAGPQTTGPVPDMLKSKWESMAKTLNTHSKDGKFNAGTVSTFESSLAEIETKLKQAKLNKAPKTALEKAEIQQLEHYLASGQELKAVHAEYVKAAAAGETPKTAVPWVKPSDKVVEDFTDDPAIAAKKAAKAAADKAAKEEADRIAALTPKPAFTVTHASKYESSVSTITNARAVNLGQNQGYEVELGSYKMDFSDGTEVTFVPRSGRLGASGSKKGLALEGTVKVRIPGDADHGAVMKTLDVLESIGIDAKAATADYREMVWLSKTVHVRNDAEKAGWKPIAAMDEGPEKIAAARKWMEKTYKVKIPQRGEPGYTADGQANSFGDGLKHVYRADLTRQAAEEKMKGYTLQHQSVGSDLEKALDGMLNSGGEATATTGRLRKGVAIGGVGMSAAADITTGGADFFFTRLRAKEDVGTNTITFKIGNIARADAVVYTRDLYGQTGNRSYRKHDVEAFKKIAAARSSDETIFKNGLFLLDELDTIHTRDAAQKGRVLDVFKKHGISILPDGRKVEDIVM